MSYGMGCATLLLLLSCSIASQDATAKDELKRKYKINISNAKQLNQREAQKGRIPNLPKLKKEMEWRLQKMPPEINKRRFYSFDCFSRGFPSKIIESTKVIVAPLDNFLWKKESMNQKILDKYPIHTVKPDPKIHHAMRYAHGDMNGTILERKALPYDNVENFDQNPDLFKPFNRDKFNQRSKALPRPDIKKRIFPKLKPEK